MTRIASKELGHFRHPISYVHSKLQFLEPPFKSAAATAQKIKGSMHLFRQRMSLGFSFFLFSFFRFLDARGRYSQDAGTRWMPVKRGFFGWQQHQEEALFSLFLFAGPENIVGVGGVVYTIWFQLSPHTREKFKRYRKRRRTKSGGGHSLIFSSSDFYQTSSV